MTKITIKKAGSASVIKVTKEQAKWYLANGYKKVKSVSTKLEVRKSPAVDIINKAIKAGKADFKLEKGHIVKLDKESDNVILDGAYDKNGKLLPVIERMNGNNI